MFRSSPVGVLALLLGTFLFAIPGSTSASTATQHWVFPPQPNPVSATYGGVTGYAEAQPHGIEGYWTNVPYHYAEAIQAFIANNDNGSGASSFTNYEKTCLNSGKTRTFSCFLKLPKAGEYEGYVTSGLLLLQTQEDLFNGLLVRPSTDYVVTHALRAAKIGTPYSFGLRAAGGTRPYTWKAISTLPRGLSLSKTGVISGIPLQRGRFPFKAELRDAVGTVDVNLPLTLRVEK